MRRGSASIAANPVLIGAATTLVIIVAVFLAYNANSGLPFVPTYELKTQVPNAAQLVEGNDVRIGGTRVGAVTDITPVTAKDGSVSALLTLKLETVRQAAAGRLDRAHPPALGAGPEVRRDHQGHVEPGLRGRRHDPAAQRDAGAGRARRGHQHLRRQDARGIAEQPHRVRQRPRRPWTRPQPRDRGAQPAAGQPGAGHADAVGPADAARALRDRAGAHGADRRPGGRDPVRAVRQPRHHLRRPRPRRAAVPAGLDQRRPARARRGDQGLPAAPALPGQQRGALPRAAPGRGRARDRRAGPGRRAGGRHAHAAAIGGVQQQPQAGLRGARALRRRPAGHASACRTSRAR